MSWKDKTNLNRWGKPKVGDNLVKKPNYKIDFKSVADSVEKEKDLTSKNPNRKTMQQSRKYFDGDKEEIEDSHHASQAEEHYENLEIMNKSIDTKKSLKTATDKAISRALEPKSFNKAFGNARKLGLKTFEWKGKKYNTKLKGE